jgi:predicted small secreted protein
MRDSKVSARGRAAVAAALLIAQLAVSGCNTMKGLGEDLSILGDKITGKAEEKGARP